MEQQISTERRSAIDRAEITIARVADVHDKCPTNCTMTWGDRKAQVLAAAATPRRGSATADAYHSLRRLSKSAAAPASGRRTVKEHCLAQKNGPGTIGGKCVPDRDGNMGRSAKNFPLRSTLVFDIDPGCCPEEFFAALIQGGGRLRILGAAVWHETHSSTEAERAVRVELLLKGPTPTAKCNAAGETLAKYIEADFPGLSIDRASLKSVQLMFDPSCPSDAPARAAGVLVGEPLDAIALTASAQPEPDAAEGVRETPDPVVCLRSPTGVDVGATDDAMELARRAREILVALGIRVEPGHATTVSFACICPDPSHVLDGVARAEWTDDGRWICRVCGKGGGIISFVAMAQGCANRDAFNVCRRALGMRVHEYRSSKTQTPTAFEDLTAEEKAEPLLELAARCKTDPDLLLILVARCKALAALVYAQQRKGIATAAGVTVAELDEAVQAKGAQEGERGGGSWAAILVAYGMKCDLFTDGAGVAYADVLEGDRRETHRIRSTAFRGRLRYLLFREHGKAARGDAMAEAIETLCAEAEHGSESQSHAVSLRSTTFGDRTYLDLCNKRWEAVEVSSDGWSTTAAPPVRFRRGPNLGELPSPVPGSIDTLRPFVNVAIEEDFVLLIAWLLYAMRGEKPYPVLVLLGEQGSGKSTLCRIIKRLIDPNTSPLRAAPSNPQDLMVSALEQHVLCYDNLSTVPAWLSDTLCRLADGAGSGQRRLYSDDEEATMSAARPLVLNGITEIVSRADLNDRAVFVTLNPIPEADRRSEKEFWRQFEVALPSILGALLDGLSCGLRTEPSIREDNLPRCADFARWGMASEGVYWTVGTFEKALRANRTAAVESVLDAEPVVAVLRDWYERKFGGWEGKLALLFSELNREAKALPDDPSHSRFWPDTPRSLGGRLRRAAPGLRRVGVNVALTRKGGDAWVTVSSQPATKAEDPRPFHPARPVEEAEPPAESVAQDEQDGQDMDRPPSAHTGEGISEHSPKGYINPETGDEADGNGGWVMR